MIWRNFQPELLECLEEKKLPSGWNLKTVLLVWSWIVLDRDVMLIPRDEKHFSMQTHISVSPKFFGWLASLGTGAVIISPENVRREYISFMKNTLMNYGEE
mgnify:CR=1 FL=1